MTIRPGRDWGGIVTAPPDLVEVATDTALAAHLDRRDGRPVRLVGGDLLASLGGPSPGPSLRRLPIDLLRVHTDAGTFTAVAHVVARRSWWRGTLLVIANVDRLGRWDVAPRAHPNDGRADVVEADAAMGLRARAQAWRRLPTGTHLPHPHLHTRRIDDKTWTFVRPLGVRVDGVPIGTTRSLRVAVEPDAATIHA